jgi:membrane fusion protein (multidrug efflux system)
MTAEVDVEIARVSPIALLLRALGEWHVAEPAPEEQHPRGFQAESEAR